MKVGITTFGCDGGKSGMSQYLIHLLQAFSAMNLKDVEFEVLTHESEKAIFSSYPDPLRVFCVSDRLRHPVLNVAWHQVCLPGYCRRRGYDVLFLPAGNRRISIHAPCPAVGTVHDFSNLHVKGKYDPARMFYQGYVLPWMVRRLKQVITISESSKRDIVECAGIPEGRVSVIPLAVDHGKYFPRDKGESAIRIRERYDIDRPYILYIARIEHPGKNHVGLIRAFEKLKDAEQIPHQLVLAGSDWNRAEEVHRIAETSRWKSDIVFPGFVPQDDLPDLYCAADIFAFPSLYEGFGLPILEAMACGTPVASSNTSSMPEVAGDAALLFDPGDPDAIAEALRSLLLNIDLWKCCVSKGLKRSRLFNWHSTASKTLEVFCKC